MQILGILVTLVVVLGPWVLAGIALVRANRAREEAQRACAAADGAWRSARAAAESAPPPEPGAPSPAVVEAVRVSASATAPSKLAAAEPSPAVPPTPTAVTATPPVPPQAPGSAAPWFSAARTAAALEEKIALVWFTRAGALAILVGAAYFLKYAIDNALLGPWGRLAAASVAGVAALALGEALRARTRAIWIHAIQGAGIALLFLAGFGSYALYHLVPVDVAFAAVAVVALLGGALAVRHRGEILLGIALAGGLLAPVLLSTGEDRPLALFGYLFVLDAAALIVSSRLGFHVAPWIAFGGTVVLGAGWHERFFDVHPPPEIPLPSMPLDEQMGRYFPLTRRLVPLGAAAAFSAAWLAVHARFRRDAPRAWADAWLAASLLFAHVALFAVVLDRPLLVAPLLAGAGVLAAALLARAGRLPFLLGAEIIALGLLAMAVGERPTGATGPWIAAAAIVAAAYLASVAHAWLLRGEPPEPALTAVAAVAGLAFSGFVLTLTGEREGLLRAALVGAAGAAELALGVAFVWRARPNASAMLGAALALFAGAAAFLFSGATITVVWAAMACAGALLAARERDHWWLGGALALFAAALVRAAALDALAVKHATDEYLYGAGATGRLEPVFLLNPRGIAFVAVALGLLLAARAARRTTESWKPIAAVLATIGWGLAVVLAITEARDLVFTLPTPPPVGDHLAFQHFRAAVSAARIAQRGALSVTTSLVMAACAALLVVGGFGFRSAFHRWLGVALFAIVLGKLLLDDVWSLSRLQQVAVFVAVGALLLAAAFLYARFGKRIAAALRDEPPRSGGAAMLIVLLAASLAAPTQALDAAPFRIARDLDGVDAPGLYAVEADADLFRASRAAPGTLADLRIEGPAGAEVPWTLRIAGSGLVERTVEGTVVDPIVLPDGAVRAIIDLGATPPRHRELRLDLAGAEFLRSVKLEASDDGRSFGVLAEGARVWSVSGTDVRRTSVRHPVSQSRFLRVTLLAGAGDPPRITGARAALDEAPAAPLRVAPLAVPVARRSPEGRESFLDVDLGAAGLPVESLELEVATRAFERRVHVLASTDGAHWTGAGGGVVWRALPDAKRERAEGLHVPANTGGRRWIRLAMVDGDSPSIQVTAIRAGWRVREIVFRAAGAGRHLLLAGADLPPPAYDLAGLLARSNEPPAAPARLGPTRPNPRFHDAEPALPFTERHRVALSVALGLLLGALALWAVRLLRRAPPPSPDGPR